MLTVYDIGIRYQFYHALALLLLACLLNSPFLAIHYLHLSGYAFIFGTFIFSGSLYLLALTGLKWLGAFTPIGGTALLLGWFFLILSIVL